MLVSDVEHVNDKQDCYKSNYVENIEKCWCISSKIQVKTLKIIFRLAMIAEKLAYKFIFSTK